MDSDEVMSHRGVCQHGSPVKAVSVSGAGLDTGRGGGGGLQRRVRVVMDEDRAREGRGMK